MRMIRILSDLTGQIRFSANRRTLTEMALIRISKPQMEVSQEAVLARMRQLEAEMEQMKAHPPAAAGSAAAAGESVHSAHDGTGAAAFADAREMPGGRAAENGAQPQEEIYPAAPEDLQKIRSEWRSIVSEVSGGFKKQMLLEAVPKYNIKENDNRLYVEFQNENAERCAKDEALKESLAGIIRRRYKISVEIEMHLSGEPKSHLREITVEEQLRRIRMPIEEVKED